jgi:hypothetical protein
MTHHFIIDSYTIRRGEPAMLELHCAQCNAFVMMYQKDGPGPLLRCYWDRIHGPKGLVGLQNSATPSTLKLLCPHCSSLIGEKGLYEKEQRLVFNLVEGSFRIQPLSSTNRK